MRDQARPITLPSELISVFLESEDSPLRMSWPVDGNTLPDVREGNLFYVREEHCAHWGKPAPGAIPAHGFTVEQSKGGGYTATPDDPLMLYYRTEMEDVPLSHLYWRPAERMPRWASRLTLRLTALPSSSCENCLFEVIKKPIRELAPLPLDHVQSA